MTACGGGGGETAAESSRGSSERQRERALAVAPPSQGSWSALRTLPLVPVSMANLPDGKVLLWSAEEKFSFGAATGRTYAATYDPAAGTITERTITETGHNMFCPRHHQPAGRPPAGQRRDQLGQHQHLQPGHQHLGHRPGDEHPARLPGQHAAEGRLGAHARRLVERRYRQRHSCP